MQTIDQFIKKKKTDNTKRDYRSRLNLYFNHIGVHPPDYFTTQRDYDKDFEDYAEHIKELSQCTQKQHLTTIQLYLRKNKVILDDDTIEDNIDNLKNTPQTQDEVPTKEILQEILSHAKAKDRALFLFSCSSGCRIDEILHLTKEEIPAFRQYEQHKPIEKPIKVKIPAHIAKNGRFRVTYISEECWDMLLEWLKVRDDWMKAACKRSKEYKEKVSDYLFPFSYGNACTVWNRLLEKAGHGQRDTSSNESKKYQRHIYHIHILRAYFKNRLMAANVQERYIEILLGHVGYVGGAYDKGLEPQIQEAYVKGESFLNIYTTTPDLSGLHDEMKEKDERIRKLEEKIEQYDRLLGIKTGLEKIIEEKINGKK